MMENRGATEPRNFEPEERMDFLLKHLGTRHEGLSAREVVRRFEQYGPRDPAPGGRSSPRFVLSQCTHPLVLLLWAALLPFVDDTTPLGLVIMAVIFLNAVFAFIEELQAEKATERSSGTCRPGHACAAGSGSSRWRRLSRPAPVVLRCARSASSRTGWSSGGSSSNWPSRRPRYTCRRCRRSLGRTPWVCASSPSSPSYRSWSETGTSSSAGHCDGENGRNV